MLVLLLVISAAIRGFLAAFLEFGNDEVYYWTYALFPDLSHFDHPPMVGWIIQLFTLDLLVDHEFFIRLGAVVFGTLNTWIIYVLGSRIRNKLTGLYAAILFTASIYCFLLSGTFILPDTPQVLFWLLSMLFLWEAFFSQGIPAKKDLFLLLAGASLGLGMLSKYTTVYLLAGTILYILVYDRSWLKRGALYASFAISALLFLPVLIWNIQNDWISFTYQGGRANFFGSGIQITSFLTEFAGQLFYNNPVNIVLIVWAFVGLIRKEPFLERKMTGFLLMSSLPLIITFLLISLFRGTLPHWSAPGYLGLILLTAAFIDDRQKRNHVFNHIPVRLQLSLLFLLIVIVLGTGQIKAGWLYQDDSEDPTRLGRNDVSLDMYGWRQLADSYQQDGYPIISHRWFPAANLDYYIAYPKGLKLFAIGDLSAVHKYAWINKERGGFQPGMDAIYITLSRDYKDPHGQFPSYFEQIIPLDTIRIKRSGQHVENVFIYKMKGLRLIPEN
jgi:hypothetical protein